ncbi:MAG: IS1634 family transposase [Pseudomonadota bacterium]
MFLRTQRNLNRTYLLLVESYRAQGRMKQRVLFRLGRLDQLRASGELDGLLLALGRFSEKFAVLGAHAEGQSVSTRARSIGAALIFERLWRDCGIGVLIEQLAAKRRFGFALERAVFLTVLHRLFAPGSDRAAEKWQQHYAIAGVEELELHQLYRTMGWLGEPVAAAGAGTATLGLCTRCELIEERLFERRRDLFTRLDLVFFDTTSIYFEGEGGESLGQYGHSKDHRPDLKQMVVGVVLDDEGRPLCSHMWLGNSADVTSLVPVVDRLRTQFKVGEVCIVADRGMISAATIEQIKVRGWRYILGVRMRRTREANEQVLARAGRFEQVYAKSDDPKAPSPLKVKEVWVEDRRYVVCMNEDQATKDRHDRDAIIASLKGALKQGDKKLIGNRGYRKYVKASGTRFSIDEDKVQDEARFDGKWVLTTNTELSARELALKYKQLWQVEATFRTMKTALATRPIFHKRDDTIRGHVFCSFLALVLRDELERRLAQRGYQFEWADILQDLERLQQIELTVNAKGYRLRTDTQGCVAKVFQACGVALPPQLEPA